MIGSARASALRAAAAREWLPAAVAAALAGGLASSMLDARTALLLAAGLGAVLLALVSRPVVMLAAMITPVFLGWNPAVSRLGAVDLTASDAFYVGLVFSLLVRSRPARPGASRPLRNARPAVRTVLIFLFLLYAGVSVGTGWMAAPETGPASLVSWARFAQTLSLVWLAPRAIASDADLLFVMRASVVAGVGAVLAAAAQAARAPGDGGGRYGGFLNPNTLGLVSGLLILAALHLPLGRRGWPRALIALTGVLGLVLSRSIGSLVGTAVAVGGHAVISSAAVRRPRDRVLKAVLAVVLGVGALVVGLMALRPESLPTSPDFRFSSTAHRAVVAAGGWEVFARDPFIGVGWRRSSDVITSREIGDTLRKRFPDVNPIFFPDVNPTSVHNTYIQVLAELGLAGFALLAGAALQLTGDLRRLLRTLAPVPRLARAGRFLALGLVLVVIWWNENPLFGGQIETVAAALYIGALAALGRVGGIASPDAIARPPP